MKRSDAVAVVVLVGIPLLVAVAFFVRPGSEADDGPPLGLGELAAECNEGGAFARCDDVDLVQSTLKNAATAEESYATSHNGRYTRRLPRLEAEGLQVPPGIDLRVVGPVRDGYCLEATAQGLKGAMSYSSVKGAPQNGPCPR